MVVSYEKIYKHFSAPQKTSVIFIVISLLAYPEWVQEPVWWLALPVVAISGAIGLLDAISGARSLFESSADEEDAGVQLDEALECYLKNETGFMGGL